MAGRLGLSALLTVLLTVPLTALLTTVRAESTFNFGFSRGEQPVDVRSPAVMQHVSGCAECHPRQHAAWSGSRHGLAWTNDVFAVAFAAEPRAWCVNCHAPLAAQAAEVDLGAYRERLRSARLVPPAPEPHAAEGVGCPACHVRDGAVLVNVPGQQMHPSRYTPELRGSEMCAGCHEFNIHLEDGSPGAVPMQATFSEWLAWSAEAPGAAPGAAPTCQDCHMPGADHRLRGVYDRDWLRESVRVTEDRGTDRGSGEDRGARQALIVETVGVGHRFPTGDLFRHLTLEEEVGGVWREIGWIGRQFGVVELPDGSREKRLTLDTALRPGAPARFVWGGGRWRLRYHYVSAEEERARRLPLEDVVWTGWAGDPS